MQWARDYSYLASPQKVPVSGKLRTGVWSKTQIYNPFSAAAQVKTKVSYLGPQILNGLIHIQHTIKIWNNTAIKIISLVILFLVFLFISKDTEGQLLYYPLSEI